MVSNVKITHSELEKMFETPMNYVWGMVRIYKSVWKTTNEESHKLVMYMTYQYYKELKYILCYSNKL